MERGVDSGNRSLKLDPMPTRPNDTFGRDLGGARLLVIDDEESVRRLVRRMLGDCNCRILEAADGFDGLMLIEREPAMDLVITDLSMPRIGGLAVVQSLLRRYPELPVVVMSGNSAAMAAEQTAKPVRRPVYCAKREMGSESDISRALSFISRRMLPATCAATKKTAPARSSAATRAACSVRLSVMATCETKAASAMASAMQPRESHGRPPRRASSRTRRARVAAGMGSVD